MAPQVRFTPNGAQPRQAAVRFTPAAAPPPTPAPELSIADYLASAATRGAIPLAPGAAAGAAEGFKEGLGYVQEGIRGGAEELGVDLDSPVVGTAKNIAGGLWGLGKEIGRIALFGDVQGATRLAGEIAKHPVEIGKEINDALESGDYDKLANSVGKGFALVGGIAVGTKGGRAATSSAVEFVGGSGVRAATKAAEMAGKAKAAITGKGINPVDLVTRALKPRSRNIRFADDMNRALPEVKAAESQLGRPIQGIDDLVEAIPLAKRQVRAQLDEIMGPQRLREIDASPVADAIEGTINAKVRLETPRRVTRLTEEAAVYRKRISIDELEEILKATNAELDVYYAKYPSARSVAKRGNPEVAAEVAKAGALRDVIYKTLDSAGGKAPRELNRRYGALMNLERETSRRRNVALRQQAESLTEQLGKVAAAMEVAKGAASLVTGDVGGFGRFGAALAGRRMAKVIKERNTADSYIRRALESYDRKPGRIAPGPPSPSTPPARALLGKFGGPSSGITTSPLYAQIINDSVGARLKTILAEARSGATEMTGKVQRAVNPANPLDQSEVLGRFGGGFRDMFPELREIDFPESPSQLAAAIDKGSGALFERIQVKVRELIEAEDGPSIREFLSEEFD